LVGSPGVELAEVLRRRRMVRSFSGKAVEPSVQRTILAAAQRTPRAGNTDGFDLVVLEGPEQTAAFWEATTTSEWRRSSRRWTGMSRAPLVICVFVDPGAYLERYGEPDKSQSGLGAVALGGGGEGAWPVPFWWVDGGFALSAMLLTSTDLGLGACFIGNFRGEEALAASLGVPAGRRYLGALLVGEPGGVDSPSRSLSRGRRPPEELVHHGRW
jgi:nitroreductase